MPKLEKLQRSKKSNCICIKRSLQVLKSVISILIITQRDGMLLLWFIDLIEATSLLSGQLTIQKLLKVIDKELSQRWPLWSLQSVEQLLDFGGDPTVDWNTYKIDIGWHERKRQGGNEHGKTKVWNVKDVRVETDVLEPIGEDTVRCKRRKWMRGETEQKKGADQCGALMKHGGQSAVAHIMSRQHNSLPGGPLQSSVGQSYSFNYSKITEEPHRLCKWKNQEPSQVLPSNKDVLSVKSDSQGVFKINSAKGIMVRVWNKLDQSHVQTCHQKYLAIMLRLLYQMIIMIESINAHTLTVTEAKYAKRWSRKREKKEAVWAREQRGSNQLDVPHILDDADYNHD